MTDRTGPTRPPAPSRWVWWLAGPVVFVLLATLGATIGIAAADNEARAAAQHQPRVTPTPTHKASQVKRTETPSPSPSPSLDSSAPARTVRVISPSFLLGRAKSTDRALKRSASEYLTLTPPDGGVKVTGVYGTSERRNVVIMLAVGNVEISDPGAFLDAWVANSYSGVTFHAIEPGTHGGDARCGPADTDTTAVTLCLWADHEAFGFFYFAYDDLRLGDTLLPTARGQVEKFN